MQDTCSKNSYKNNDDIKDALSMEITGYGTAIVTPA